MKVYVASGGHFHVYSQSSVFIIASVEDGLAPVQAQAMAGGLPVIATPNTGAEDLFTIGVDGFIVSVRRQEIVGKRFCTFMNS